MRGWQMQSSLRVIQSGFSVSLSSEEESKS